MEETKQSPKIYKAMADIMQDIEAILKTRENTMQKYKFRGIDDVYNAVNPLLKKHRVFMLPEILESTRDVKEGTKTSGEKSYTYITIMKVKIKYMAEDGSFVETLTQGEGMDFSDKSSNKAMSAAQKYSIIQVFAIPTEEGSPDADSDSIGADELKLALEQIELFTDVERLTTWGNDQTQFHKTKEFVNAVQNKIKALNKAAK